MAILTRSSWIMLQQSPKRFYSTSLSLPSSPFAPRHLLSISDLTALELATLIRNAFSHKVAVKSGSMPKSLLGSLAGQTIALMFNKRSTRTRVSTESAAVLMGGYPMFLGKEDIQLGVNESLYDTAVVVSSMVSSIVARVGPHADVVDLAKYSSVPVISALSDTSHPLQTVADFLTIYEALPTKPPQKSLPPCGIGLEGLNIAWIGDANNVLFDLAIGAMKLGLNVRVATPRGYEIPKEIETLIRQNATKSDKKPSLETTNIPEEALKDADIIVTDTWISMGQESEKSKRLEAFRGFQITRDLIRRGGARESWRFMHCLPRHPEEVSDEIFYSPNSLVFQEAENRLWAATSVLEAFVTNKGVIVS